jgi:hypothetical protein
MVLEEKALMFARTVLATVAFSASITVNAQHYPERPLRFVVPFPPGGGADNLARIVATALNEKLGQPAVVDNRAGAGGNIAAEVVSKAAPDGYTLLQANVAHAISASLYRKLNYDLLRDFAPVTQLASIPFVLAVSPQLGARSVKEVIALAKAKPDTLSYASSGSGGPSHLAMELFKSMAHVDIRHIPYKGAAPGSTALTANNVQLMFFTVSAALAAHGGRSRALPGDCQYASLRARTRSADGIRVGPAWIRSDHVVRRHGPEWHGTADCYDALPGFHRRAEGRASARSHSQARIRDRRQRPGDLRSACAKGNSQVGEGRTGFRRTRGLDQRVRHDAAALIPAHIG